jgi:predicted DNA-binding transcriptional regulator YafY
VNKLERLLNLTAVLLATPRPLTADELRERVEGYPPPGSGFRRAFERDKDDLRVLGIPLRVEPTTSGDTADGYRIDPDDYYLPDPGLEPDELAALHLASLAIRLDGLSEREALWKLGGLVDTGASLADQTVASLPSDPALVPLFQAIVDRRQVSFRYRDQDRTVDPWRLDFQRGRWYLTGFDHVRGEDRNYRLDRIVGEVGQTGTQVQRPGPTRPTPDGPIPAWELGADEPTTAKLRIDADQAAAARRQLGVGVAGVEQADGSVVFEVPVVNYDAFRAFLLGFLHRAELLEPPEWRADIIDWLERTRGE